MTRYFLVQDDTEWNNVISMAIFRSEEAPENFL